MIKKSLVIGRGEIGNAVYEVLKDKYGKKIFAYDIKDEKEPAVGSVDILHICIPWCDGFVGIVDDYVSKYKAKYTVVHSSVPVGTTARLGGRSKAFHSPVRGKHPDMENGLKTYVKYLSFDGVDHEEAVEISNYFYRAGIECKIYPDTKVTELGKLLALARYGVNIAFAKEQERICERFGVGYHKAVTEFERSRTEGLKKTGEEQIAQPLLWPFENFVGGHCTIEDMKIILDQFPTPLMQVAHHIGRNTKIWDNCNIYDTATIGKGCNIGGGCEIGEYVVIGNNVRIGAMCFIPEGVTIEDDVFVAPKVTFSNDKYPPSSQEHWGKILIKKGAVIGMGSIILPDVTVGEGALIGAGSVVTKNVPDGEKWYGNPAHAHGEVKND